MVKPEMHSYVGLDHRQGDPRAAVTGRWHPCGLAESRSRLALWALRYPVAGSDGSRANSAARRRPGQRRTAPSSSPGEPIPRKRLRGIRRVVPSPRPPSTRKRVPLGLPRRRREQPRLVDRPETPTTARLAAEEHIERGHQVRRRSRGSPRRGAAGGRRSGQPAQPPRPPLIAALVPRP